MMADVWVALTRRRWWAVPGIAVMTTLLALMSLNSMVLPYRHGGINQWDVFLGVWDAPLMVAVIMPITFFSLIVDLISPTMAEHNGYFLMSRASTRWRWWVRKIGSLGVLTVVFVGLLWLGIALISVATVRWAMPWSDLASATQMRYPGGLSSAQLTQPPPEIMALMTLLVAAGLYAWGLGVLVIGWITRKAIWGWMVGAVLGMLSYGLWMVHGTEGWWVWAPLLQLLLSIHQGFHASVAVGPPLWQSFIVDGVVWVTAATLGFAVLRRRVL